MQVQKSKEAMKEYEKYKHFLNETQQSKLLSATVSKDGDEWCILSGSDMTFDRAGFGKDIHSAMIDYLSIYVKHNKKDNKI